MGDEAKPWDGKERRISYGLDPDTLVKITEMHSDVHHLVENFKTHINDDNRNFTSLKNSIDLIQKIVWMAIGGIVLIQFLLPLFPLVRK